MHAWCLIACPILLHYLHVWEQTRVVVLRPGTADRLVWNWTRPYQEPFLFYWAGVLKTAGIDTRSRNFAEDVGTQILWLVGPAGTIAVGQLRGNLQDDGSCALCSQESETIFHLLVVSCSFARREVCWYGVLLLIGHYPRSFWVHTNSST